MSVGVPDRPRGGVLELLDGDAGREKKVPKGVPD
jgi:hypothetical protein